MNNSYIRNQDDFSYRVELVACNIAIQTLARFSSVRSWIQRGAAICADHAFPIWVGGMALSGIIGMLSGFSIYCLMTFAR